MKLSNQSNCDYTLSSKNEDMDIIAIHHYLSNHANWSLNISLETLKKAMENSLNFGVFYHSVQVGFARVITDHASIAYLGDMYILPEHRGKGLSKLLMETIIKYPGLEGLSRWILLTRNANDLYKKYGSKSIAIAERWMEKHNPGVYYS
jgi:GNAT superfamily N-acetyltransferase